MQIAFIGGGVMGEAMIRGILSKGLATPEEIIANDISGPRRSTLAENYRIRTTEDYGIAVKGANIIVIAVKPQNLSELMPELKDRFVRGHLVLSIVAGASLVTIANGLGHKSVVRAMPNTPAQIGEGMSVWTASSEVSESQKEVAKSILGALGKEIYVSDEKYIDMATAISGSGPAYIFLVIEALIDAAVHIGWPRETAGELVLQTVLGATRLAQETGKHPVELRNMVTSPGGTTVEGLLQLEEGGLRALLAHAVIAAYEKAKILERE
ncbi:MAG: pyrroline-5-carboxylate reductase [Dehalococcoidia bacterium]|nr:MAG: pyrroline-5-carboxylate reductase [Dehalococcoidia bacterium]